MSVHFGELAKRVGADGVITPEEVLTLRREAWPDGRISQAEAEAIFALNRELTTKSAEWVDFFVEALGEYVINQRAPTGYVDPENASWLMMHWCLVPLPATRAARPASPGGGGPKALVISSHGLGGTREISSSLLLDLASRGHVVVEYALRLARVAIEQAQAAPVLRTNQHHPVLHPPPLLHPREPSLAQHRRLWHQSAVVPAHRASSQQAPSGLE